MTSGPVVEVIQSLTLCGLCILFRRGSSPKILGGSPKLEKYELHIGLHLKSIISGVANSVMGLDPETRKNEA